MLLTRVTRQQLVWQKAEVTRRVQNVCLPAELRLQALLDRLLGVENDVSGLALQAAAKLAALAEAPFLMVGLLVAAVSSGVLWVLLLRASLRLFMWTLLVLTSFAVAGLGAALLVAEPQLPSPFSDLDLQPGLRKALGALSLVAGMWALPRFYCANARKMGLAVYTVREGCLIVFDTPLLALLPLLELALRIGLILAAGGGAALLFSAAEVHAAKVRIFGELVAGVPRSFEPTAELVMGLLHVGFALVWYQELISAISTFVVSRTAVLSYFGSACLGVPSTSSALLSHLGSFALGAANSACLLIPRLLGLAREFNHHAYVDMAITAAPLLESSCSASTLLAGSGFVLAARGILLRAVLLVGSVAFSAGCGLAANAFLAAAQAGAAEDGQAFAWARSVLAVVDPGVPGGLPEAITAELEALGSPVTAGAAVAVVAFLVVQSFAAVIDTVADAVLYCSLWDRQAGTEVEQVPSRFRNVIDTQAFIDPISHEIMADPVVAADGHSYERSSITRWFQQSSRSPMTNADLDNCNVVPNIALRQQIEAWTQSSLLQR